MKKIVIFASGNGSNFQNIVDYFSADKSVEISLLVCNKENAYVIERAQKQQIPYLLINRHSFYSSNEVFEKIETINPNLIILAGFLWLVPEYLIESFPQKIINIHPALLPKYGGKGMYGMNVHRAVKENKETETGITIHYVNKEYDKGSIIFQAKTELTPSDTAEEIADKVHQLESLYFPKTIKKLLLSQK